MKYRIENKAADAAQVYLYDEIGYWGTSAQQFANDLKDITASKIDLHINSYGGEVFDGVAIFNAIRQHKAHVTVYIDGVAASAASFIAMAGDRVIAARNATIMIHDALTVAIGNAAELRREADLLDKISENIADIYSQKAGGPVSGWRQAMQTETWYSAAEALTAGLVDEVTDADSEQDDPLEKVAAEFDRMIMARAGGGRPRGRERAFPLPLPVAAASTTGPPASTTTDPDDEQDTAPGTGEDIEPTPEPDPEPEPEPVQEPTPDPVPEPAPPVPEPVPEPDPVPAPTTEPADFDPDAFRAGLTDALPREKPWDPDQFRLAMQAVALDVPAPRDYRPAPAPQSTAPVVVPDPRPPVDESPFDGDLFRAAMQLVANDAPAPPDRSREQKPATAQDPDFSLQPDEFARAIREARL